jgi:hypothetical protein
MTIADQPVCADPGGDHVIVQLNAWQDRGRIILAPDARSGFPER